jgi:enamine deaminase RidA (YjgF/YER057c/UK114 family)
MAIRTRGDQVFLPGANGLRPGRQVRRPGRRRAQVEQARKKIVRLMTEARGTITDVGKRRDYVTEVAYRPGVYAQIDKYFEGVHHRSTGIVVSRLALPRAARRDRRLRGDRPLTTPSRQPVWTGSGDKEIT